MQAPLESLAKNPFIETLPVLVYVLLADRKVEMDGLIAALLGLMEPALIVTMGAIVLMIVLAILLPIFQLNQLVG